MKAPISALLKAIFLSPSLDDVLGGQDACQLVGGLLAGAFEHHAGALLRRREGGQNVGGRALQADGSGIDQGVILQGLIGHGDQGLAISARTRRPRTDNGADSAP